MYGFFVGISELFMTTFAMSYVTLSFPTFITFKIFRRPSSSRPTNNVLKFWIRIFSELSNLCFGMNTHFIIFSDIDSQMNLSLSYLIFMKVFSLDMQMWSKVNVHTNVSLIRKILPADFGFILFRAN